MTAPAEPTRPTVTVPVIGTVQRRWLFVGGAAVAVIVAYAYMRRRATVNAPATFDPATGSPTSGGTYVNPVPGGNGGSDTVDSTPTSIDTNAQWVQAVIADLAGLDINVQFALTALGNYLAAPHNGTVALDEDQLRIVRQAWALRGQPPEGAATPVLATPGVTTPPPSTTPPPTPPPATTPPQSTSTRAHVDAGSDVYLVVAQLFGGEWTKFETLNPGIRSKIYWVPRPGNPDGNQPYFTTDVDLNTA